MTLGEDLYAHRWPFAASEDRNGTYIVEPDFGKKQRLSAASEDRNMLATCIVLWIGVSRAGRRRPARIATGKVPACGPTSRGSDGNTIHWVSSWLDPKQRWSSTTSEDRNQVSIGVELGHGP